MAVFTTRHSIAVGIVGLGAVAVAYLMTENGGFEQKAEREAMEARSLAKADAVTPQPASTAPVAAPAVGPIADEPAADPEVPAPEQSSPASASARQPSASDHPLLGSWRCAFRSGEYSYPPMACEIRRKDGGYTLEKTQGSQRIKGKLALEGDARFAFSGLFFCPQGACDAQVQGTFMRKATDSWIGVLNGMDSGGVVVTMTRPLGK
jgi:hypothetical protein